MAYYGSQVSNTLLFFLITILIELLYIYLFVNI